jgi:uncharacterized repeat protein (TIGR01451 family)
MVKTANLLIQCGFSRLFAAKTLSVFSLLLGGLLLSAMPQMAFAQTQVTNTASVTLPAGVTNTNTATSCVGSTCTAEDRDAVTPSLPTVSKTFSPSTISAGGTSLLVITFTNTHRLVSATFSALFTDAYPAGLVNTNPTVTSTTCLSGIPTATPGAGQLTLPIGTLIPPNSSCSVSAVVTSVASPLAPNTIPAGSLTTSVGANPTSAIATLTVNPSADLIITKTTANATPSSGGTFTYTIVIGNSGPSAVANALWQDILPTGLGTITNVVTTAGITATVGGGGDVIVGSTDLASGQLATVSFQVSVALGVSGTLTNTASVSPPVGTIDPSLANNSSSVAVNAVSIADLAIVKTRSNANPNAGSTFTYTIVITNNGPVPVTDAIWQDALPSGLGTISNVVTSAGIAPVVSGSGTFIGGTSTLANGASATVTFQVSVAPGATGTLTNTVSVTPPAGITDPTPGNNTNSVTVTIGQVASLAVTKDNGSASLTAGGTTSYTVTFSNGGPSAANGALVRDVPSAGLQCISVTCTATSGGASCPSSMLPLGTVVPSASTNFFTTGETIGTLPANSTVTVVVNCNVTATGQ